jgi:ABC-2 type transport system ATP-binding protein
MMAAMTAPASKNPAIRVEGLVRRFGDLVAVDGLSFEVARGETFGLLGHNGAGKTTTIRVVNGVLGRQDGNVAVLGLDPATDGEAVRARTGVLTETPSLDERLTANENLEFYGRLYGVAGSELGDRVEASLRAFGLEGRARERVAGFSRGMKQRVALARTLLHDPEIVFLDEPTAALDPVAAREVHELVEGFRRDRRRTVVLTTHNLVEAQRLCDRVAILQRGRALAVGTPAELGRAAQSGGSVVIVLAPGEVERARTALNDAGFGDVRVDGEGVRVAIDSAAVIPSAVRALVSHGLSVYRVAETQPDLEAGYFALHARTTEPGAGEGAASTATPR